MAYGITVVNSNNEVQIDGGYRNLSVVTFGTWAMSNTPYGARKYFGTTIVDPPVIAIQPQSVLSVSHKLYTDPSGNYDSCYVHSAASHTLPYIVLNEPDLSEIPSTEFGLEVYDANGNLVFHNSNKWMRLIGIYTFTSPWGSDCATTTGYRSIDISVQDTNNNYFLMRPYIARSLGGSWVILAMKAIDSTTMRIEWTQEAFIGVADHVYCADPIKLIEIST